MREREREREREGEREKERKNEREKKIIDKKVKVSKSYEQEERMWIREKQRKRK